MKGLNIIINAALPLLLAAATLDEPVSTEDRLRDHLRMFRQVFGGNDRFYAPTEETNHVLDSDAVLLPQETDEDAEPKIDSNIIPANLGKTTKRRKPHKHHQRSNMTRSNMENPKIKGNTTLSTVISPSPESVSVVEQGNETGKNTDFSSDSDSTSGSDTDTHTESTTETETDTDSSDSDSDTDTDTEHDVDTTTDEKKFTETHEDTEEHSQQEAKPAFEQDSNQEIPELNIDISLDNKNETTPEDHGILIEKEEEITEEETDETAEKVTEETTEEAKEDTEEDTKDDTKDDTKEDTEEDNMGEGSLVAGKEINEGTNEETTQEANEDLPGTRENLETEEEYSDDEEIEDKKLSELLASGLKSLLTNQPNNSAVFELPDLDTAKPATPTSKKDTPSTTKNEIKDDISVSTPSSIALFIDDSGVSEQNPDSEEDVQHPKQGKKNLKSVIDLGRKMRTPLREHAKIRKGSQRQMHYQEEKISLQKGSNISTNLREANHVSQPKKLQLKDLIDHNLNGFHDDIDNREKDVDKKIKSEVKAKSNETKGALSEIRKMYFDSLERSTDEDLLAYFHRIYPELQHLVGDRPRGDTRHETPQASPGQGNQQLETEPFESPTTKPPVKYEEVSRIPKRVVKIHYEKPKSEKETKEDQPETDFGLDLKRFRQFHDRIRERETDTREPEHKTLLQKIGDTFQKLRSETAFFHNPFDHDFTSEAANSAEIYPSVVGAVILALFLILL